MENTTDHLCDGCRQVLHDVCRGILHDSGDNVRNTLIHAVVSEHDKCVKSLLDSGADVNVADDKGNFPLAKAAEQGYISGVNILLEAGADVNKTYGETKSTALDAAALSGHVDCVDALIKAGSDVNMIDNDSSMCAIVAAVKSGSERCIGSLLKAGADVNLKCEGGWYGKTNALLEAVECGNEDIVKLLLREGADVNDIEGTKNPPLTVAAELGYFKIVDLLIKAGANVNEEKYSWRSALIEVSRCSSHTRPTHHFTKCVELLLRAGADVNVMDNEFDTPLVIAVKLGFDEGLDLLIKAGSDVNEYTYDLYPLMYAAGLGFPKSVQLLLAAGADVNNTNKMNQTAFSKLGSVRPSFTTENIDENKILQNVMSKVDHIQCGRILLGAGARINNTDEDSNNALRHYIGANRKNPQRDICMFLYAAGETTDGTTITVSDPEYHPMSREECETFHADVPRYLHFEDLRFRLKHLCRQTIRKHLLNLDPHEHLFGRIPRLGLPLPLSKYLLFKFSLDD